MKEKIEKLLDIETLDRNLFRGEGEGAQEAENQDAHKNGVQLL